MDAGWRTIDFGYCSWWGGNVVLSQLSFGASSFGYGCNTVERNPNISSNVFDGCLKKAVVNQR